MLCLAGFWLRLKYISIKLSPFLPGPLSLALLASFVGFCPFLPGFRQCASNFQIEYVGKVLAASTKRCWSMACFRFPRVFAVFIWTIEHYIRYCSFSIQSLCNVYPNPKLSMLCLARFWPHPRKDVGAEAGSAFPERLHTVTRWWEAGISSKQWCSRLLITLIISSQSDRESLSSESDELRPSSQISHHISEHIGPIIIH